MVLDRMRLRLLFTLSHLQRKMSKDNLVGKTCRVVERHASSDATNAEWAPEPYWHDVGDLFVVVDVVQTKGTWESGTGGYNEITCLYAVGPRRVFMYPHEYERWFVVIEDGN